MKTSLMEPSKDKAEESYEPEQVKLLILNRQAHFEYPRKEVNPNHNRITYLDYLT